jgi:hypothetical protein
MRLCLYLEAPVIFGLATPGHKPEEIAMNDQSTRPSAPASADMPLTMAEALSRLVTARTGQAVTYRSTRCH